MSSDPENFDKLNDSYKVDSAKFFGIVAKLNAQENEEDSVKNFETLSKRIKILESKEQIFADLKTNNCFL